MSGWHCALMCGGIAAAVEGQATSMVHFQRARQLFYLQLTMHLGRITTYTLLGGIAAWVGIFVWRQDIVLIQRPLFFISSSLLIFMGIRLLLRNHP